MAGARVSGAHLAAWGSTVLETTTSFGSFPSFRKTVSSQYTNLRSPVLEYLSEEASASVGSFSLKCVHFKNIQTDVKTHWIVSFLRTGPHLLLSIFLVLCIVTQ